MHLSLPPELQDSDIQAVMVAALRRSYEISQERHDPGVGDDLMTFGIHVSKSGAFYLELAINDLPDGWAKVVQHSLAMRIGEAQLRHHKVGESEEDDPYKSFPGSAGPAARMTGRSVQLELPFTDGKPPKVQRVYYDWVLCSYGNHEDGLRAARLQAVGDYRALDGTIGKWEDVVTLFDASAGASIPVSQAAHQPRTDDIERAVDPEIALHDEDAGGAGPDQR